MRRRLVFLPEVSRDFADTFAYYETLSPGHGGLRFEAAFKKALQQAKAGLVTHSVAFERFHRVSVPRFPYGVYYRLVGDEAVIVALLYSRLDPSRLQATLQKRV